MPKPALTFDFRKLDPIVAKYVDEFYGSPKEVTPPANNGQLVWLRDAISRLISKHRKLYEMKEMELLRIPSGGDATQCIKKPLKLKEPLSTDRYGDKDYLLTNGQMVKLIEMYGDDRKGSLRTKVEQLASITRRAAELGVGPKIYDFYTCSMPSAELYAVFRMEHIKGKRLKEVAATLTPEEKKTVTDLASAKLDILHANQIAYRRFFDDQDIVLIYKGKKIVDMKFMSFNGSVDINNNMDLEFATDRNMIQYLIRTNDMDTKNIDDYVVLRMLEDGHISVIE